MICYDFMRLSHKKILEDPNIYNPSKKKMRKTALNFYYSNKDRRRDNNH